jgi:hypothetical protein
MAGVVKGRMTAEIDGDFVVFLIGMRINKWWKVHKWWPVAMAMPRMVNELNANPGIGCLHAQMGLGTIVQYWRSFEHLDAYARDAARAHLPAWKAFNEKVRATSGDVGIWHETFRVRAGDYEAIYGSTPRRGLALAGRLVPIVPSKDSARQRMA